MSDKIEIYDANGVKRLAGAAVAAIDAADVVYTPAANADWNSSTDPGDVNDALDQLADRMVAVEAAALPGYIVIEEQQTANTQSGTFTAAAWQKRVLNTKVTDTLSRASIASSVITLAAGTYEIVLISCPAFVVNGHQCRLQNTSDAATVAQSPSEYSGSSGAYCTTRAEIKGYQFTIAGSKDFEVQHRCATTRATDGLGESANIGETEVYTRVILKVLA